MDHSQHTQRWFVRGRVHVVALAAEVEDQYQHSQCWLEQEDSRDVISVVEVEQPGDRDSLDALTSRLVREGLAAAIGRRVNSGSVEAAGGPQLGVPRRRLWTRWRGSLEGWTSIEPPSAASSHGRRQ